jgi:hypothetical protein
MSSGEACVRIRVQNMGFWNPPAQDRNQALPAYLGALTAANQVLTNLADNFRRFDKIEVAPQSPLRAGFLFLRVRSRAFSIAA